MKNYKYYIDSRSITDPTNAIFIAIKSNTGDGHNYISQLYEKGVRKFWIEDGFLTNNRLSYKDASFTEVESIIKHLHLKATEKLHENNNPVLAITGSRGKTIVKEWINTLLNNEIERTPRSFNSQIGVPLSVLNAKLTTGSPFIVEVGISQKGEMAKLENILKPEIVVLTNITKEHSDGFKNQTEQFKEKLLLARNAKSLIIYSNNQNDFNEEINRLYTLMPCLKKDVEIILCHRTVTGISLVISKDGNINEHNIALKRTDLPSFLLDIDSFYSANLAIALTTIWLIKGEIRKDVTDRIKKLHPINTRLNFREGINKSTLIVDNFSSDAYSLEQSLDYTRRLTTKESPKALIINNLCNVNLKIEPAEILNIIIKAKEYGFKKIILLDNELQDGEINSQLTVIKDSEQLKEFLPPLKLDTDTLLFHTPEWNDNFIEILGIYEVKKTETSMMINLDAMIKNFNYFKSKLQPTTDIICMLKAFGYGTGSVEIAHALEVQGASALAVAVIDEGIELREKGIRCPIMILNPHASNLDSLRDYNLEPVIYNFDLLNDIERFVEINRMEGLKIHIKFETGMRRLGFTVDEIRLLISRLNNMSTRIHVKSCFSHLATADCLDMDEYTHSQISLFNDMSRNLEIGLGYKIKRHILNSAGILRFPEAQYDMVRLGIGLYGIKTLPGALEKDLQQVASLKTTIISLKLWKQGESIGYGRRTILKRDSMIATVPIGYADGIDRRLGNGNGNTWVNGYRCPIVGNICMDIMMIDVTDVPKCTIGTEVEIFGDNISINEIAQQLDTIPYEVLTSVSKRVNRIYYKD